MRILIFAVGKIKDRMLKEKVDEYFGRLGKGIEVLVREVPDGKAGAAAAVKKQEAERILSLIPERDFVAALDERGKEMDSLEFAGFLTNLISRGRNLVMIIGGAYGLDESVRKRADLVMALSRLTFSHELARLILAEQIFRGFSIIKRTPYHH